MYANGSRKTPRLLWQTDNIHHIFMEPQAIKIIIEEFLDKLTVHYERIELVGSTNGRLPQFVIQSNDSHLLIGRSGAGLDALNLLLRQMVRRRTGEETRVDFMVDVNRYRTRQNEELIRAAEMFAERARLFQRDVEMPPAPAFERMVVHAHFADNPDMMTESAGEGKFRHIVIKQRLQIADP